MGSEVSTCCGGGGDRETQLDIPASAQELVSPHKSLLPTTQHFTSQEIDEFKEKFYAGITVHVILQDKTKLACQVRLDRTHEFLLLSCDKKVRAIGLRDVKCILHTLDQLKRVESAAGIIDPDTCAAIHLSTSGNCIPLFFETPCEKELFVEVTECARATMKK